MTDPAASPSPILPPESWRQRYPEAARFIRSRVAVAALFTVIVIVLTVIFGPVLWSVQPDESDLDLLGSPQPPSLAHPAGTDYQGRDLLARLFFGGRISLTVGIVSMLINLTIGVGLGTIAAWAGGWIDTLLMRFVDALYSIPLLLIVIILQVFVSPFIESHIPASASIPMLLSPDLISIYLALGLANWLTMARLARGEVLNQAKRDYVSAAEALGVRPWRILLRHVLPNSMAPILVAATLAIPEAIFIEAFLAFIGIGVSPPMASWGTLASDAVHSIAVSPHLLLFPAIAISVTMLAFNLFGDGLRDALDPSSQR
ncbi:ABC transporter permease [Candidatus Poribacteria bacterium]|nr:ABC transporter permease [Candidatus Poribacteria bacterium]